MQMVLSRRCFKSCKLEEFRKGILDHYHSVGRYNAKVDTIVNTLPNNRAEVKIQIVEDDVALLKILHLKAILFLAQVN
ncbi:protective surface antigen D15 [Pasteurella canis]|nr:protective surface antigen D15 [Pasteurella canis]